MLDSNALFSYHSAFTPTMASYNNLVYVPHLNMYMCLPSPTQSFLLPPVVPIKLPSEENLSTSECPKPQDLYHPFPRTAQDSLTTSLQTIPREEAPVVQNTLQSAEVVCHQKQSSEFQPRKKKAKKSKTVKKAAPKTKQSENRNIIPNIVHQAFSFLAKKPKSCSLVTQLLKELQQSGCCGATVSRFYFYQRRIKQKMNHYLNEEAMFKVTQYAEPSFEIFPQAEQDLYLKISRILVWHYLRNICPMATMTSRRMAKDKRFEHLRARRLIQDKYEQMFS